MKQKCKYMIIKPQQRKKIHHYNAKETALFLATTCSESVSETTKNMKPLLKPKRGKTELVILDRGLQFTWLKCCAKLSCANMSTVLGVDLKGTRNTGHWFGRLPPAQLQYMGAQKPQKYFGKFTFCMTFGAHKLVRSEPFLDYELWLLHADSERDKQKPHFRTYSRRALYEFTQTLHGDKSSSRPSKRCHFLIQRIVFLQGARKNLA